VYIFTAKMKDTAMLKSTCYN